MINVYIVVLPDTELEIRADFIDYEICDAGTTLIFGQGARSSCETIAIFAPGSWCYVRKHANELQ